MELCTTILAIKNHPDFSEWLEDFSLDFQIVYSASVDWLLSIHSRSWAAATYWFVDFQVNTSVILGTNDLE